MVKRLQTSWNWPWVSPTTVTLVASSCKSNYVVGDRSGGVSFEIYENGTYWGFKVGLFQCLYCATVMYKEKDWGEEQSSTYLD